MAEVFNVAHATRFKNSSSKKTFARASARHSGNFVLQFRSGGAGRRLRKFRQTQAWFCWMRPKNNGGLLKLQRHWNVGKKQIG